MSAGHNLSNSTGTIIGGYYYAAPQAITGAGAITVNQYKSNVTTGAGAAALTLADGTFIGQRKAIQLVVDGGGTATLTPVNLSGGTTIAFADAGDRAELLWDGSNWLAIDLLNLADGATAPVLA